MWSDQKRHFVKRSSLSAYILLSENHLIPAFGKCTDVITENQVQAFILEKIGGGLSQKTVKDIVIVLKMILKYGSKHDLIEYKIWDLQYPTKQHTASVEVFTIAENKKLMNYIKEHFTFRNLGVLICISTGLRIGEVCALTWNDIDIDNGVVIVRRTIQRIYEIDRETGTRKTVLVLDAPKTKNSNREVPLSPDLIKIIRPVLKIVNKDFYILTNDEKPTEPRTYRSYYFNLMESLELPLIKFHGLRHTFATRCINAKVDVKTLSVMLGHSNISTTLNIYVHPNMEQKKAAITQMFKSLK